jgi:hypothetical protein
MHSLTLSQWYYEKVFPLLKAPQQRVWVVPGLFGDDRPANETGAGNVTFQVSTTPPRTL